MLKILRNKKTARKIWIILAVIILPAFVLWGSGSVTKDKTKGDTDIIGKVRGRKINLAQYRDSVNAVRNQAIIQFGDKFTEVQKYMNFDTQAWERIILLEEARSKRIAVSDNELMEALASYPFFQNKGKFDFKVYSDMLKYVFRTQERVFEEETRGNIKLAKLFKQTTDNMKIDDELIRKEYEKVNQQLSLYYIVASFADSNPKDRDIKEENLKEYYEKNKLEFKQPLSFNLEYLSSDSEDKISKLLPHANKNEYLQKLAKDAGLTFKETGLFAENNAIPGIGWSPQILSLIAKLQIGQYLPPIQIDKTFYLLRLKEKKEPYIPSYDEIKNKVKETFIKHAAEAIAKTKIEDCLAKLKQESVNQKTADFEKAAKLSGLKTGATELFKYGSYIEGIGASDIFWIVAKDLKPNEFSEPILLPSGYYIVKLKSKTNIDEKKFAEEKITFASKLLFQKKQDSFSNYINELKNSAQRYQ